MVLKVLGSSSAGNCYILESDDEALIIEAGVPFKEVKVALGFNVRKIVGVVAGHCHKDHSGYIDQYKGICPIYKPYEVNKPHERFGNFFIKAFSLVHDVECYGFYIEHPDIGSLIYASDTEYIKYRFKNLNHILVEANHSTDLVDRNSVKYEHQIRGHMNINTTCDFLRCNNNNMLLNVVLLHLSSECSDEEKFKEMASKTVDCPVYIAKRGLEIDMSLLPF